MEAIKKNCSNCLHRNDSGVLDDIKPICWNCSSYTKKGIEEYPCWRPDVGSIVDSIHEQYTSAATVGKEASDGSSADYYKLPAGATQLQDLISHKNMNAQVGEIFRACYRMGQVSHSPNIRDVKKILFYAQAELSRLEKLGGF